MRFANSLFARRTTSKRLTIALIFSSILFLLFAAASPAAAQSGHSVTLAWTASADAAANPTLTYNVYRLNGSCPAVAPTAVSTSGFTKMNTAALLTTGYTDATVSVGTYCYFATAFLTATESIPSNDASGMILPKPPTSLGVPTITEMLEVTVPPTV